MNATLIILDGDASVEIQRDIKKIPKIIMKEKYNRNNLKYQLNSIAREKIKARTMV